MIGAEAYAWRLEHALLLRWSAEELLTRAEAELAEVDAEIAALVQDLEPPAPPTPQEVELAESMDGAVGYVTFDSGIFKTIIGHVGGYAVAVDMVTCRVA